MKLLYFIIGFWAFMASPLLAQERVESLEIKGLFRTEEEVVKRELTFEIPGQAEVAEIEEFVQRLRNLGIFRIVNYTLVDRHLVVEVDEKWTILPMFSIQSGGRLSSLLIGAFDANLAGKYMELGGRYLRLGDTNSFALWLYDQRFLNQRSLGGVDLWWSNRLRTLYSKDGELEGGYLRLRKLARFLYSKEFNRDFELGGSLAVQNDTFSRELLGPSVLELNSPLPEDTFGLLMTGTLRLGRLDIDNYIVEGSRFSQSLTVALPGSSFTAFESTSQFSQYIRFPWRQNIAWRLGYAFTTSDEIEQGFFIGGFDTVRGYLDSRFRGTHAWYANAEYRIGSLDYKWLALQHTAFVDGTGVSDDFRTSLRLSGASAGFGLRIMVPKVYSVVARVDYAFPLIGGTTGGLSFGAQQFF